MNDFKLDAIKSFNPNSKLWIFQSLDFLDKEEIIFISKSIEQFIPSWNSHGKEIKSTSFIIQSHFIFVVVDSNFSQASGCSIDSLFIKIKEIGNSLNKDLLKRNFIAFQPSSSERINFLSLSDFKKYIKTNMLSSDFIIFDNSISVLKDFKNWKMNIRDWKLKFLYH